MIDLRSSAGFAKRQEALGADLESIWICADSISGWKQVYIDKNAARSGYWWRLNCPFGNDSLSGRCRSSHCIDVTAQEMNRRLLKWKANLADRQD
jgi:hypothetical protein